jgi:hypothetical protein
MRKVLGVAALAAVLSSSLFGCGPSTPAQTVAPGTTLPSSTTTANKEGGGGTQASTAPGIEVNSGYKDPIGSKAK